MGASLGVWRRSNLPRQGFFPASRFIAFWLFLPNLASKLPSGTSFRSICAIYHYSDGCRVFAPGIGQKTDHFSLHHPLFIRIQCPESMVLNRSLYCLRCVACHAPRGIGYNVTLNRQSSFWIDHKFTGNTIFRSVECLYSDHRFALFRLCHSVSEVQKK